MDKPLMGHKIAILVANGFDETDMSHAQRALATLGASLKIISTENGLVNSWTGTSWGHHFPTDGNVSTVLAADFDGLYVPGGKRSSDKLKDSAHVRRILRGFFDAGKPMLLMGTSVELLANAERATGCTVTGDPACEKTMIDAGATWATATPAIHSFLATAQGSIADNAMFTQLAAFYGQTDDMKQAA